MHRKVLPLGRDKVYTFVMVMGFLMIHQLFATNCGKPYPWTTRRAEALAEAIDELDELQAADRDKLKQSIPDVLRETAKTETAAARFGKAIRGAGSRLAL
jgi:hypothetical protein